MEEIMNQSANNVEVAEPQIEAPEQVESQEISENSSEVADPKPGQDAETNARFAEQRRNQELNEFKTKASTYEQNLNRVAQFAGYASHEDMLLELETAEKQQQIQQESERLGINEDAYKEHFEPVNNELSQLKSELESLRGAEQQRMVEREISELKQKYEDFADYESKVFDVAIEKGYTLEDAYKISTYDDRMAKIGREKEQEVLARVTGRDERQVLASNDQPNNTKFDPSNMSFEEIEKLSKRARMGERITF